MAFQYNHYYEIYNGGKYVNLNGDHENNVVTNGEKVTMYARTNNPDQRWALERYGSDNKVRIVLQRGGGWYALNYNTENTNCIVWHLNSAADKDTVITLEPAVSFGGVYRLKLAQRNLYLTVVGSSLKWMAFTNKNDQVFSFVEPGADPNGSGTDSNCGWPLPAEWHTILSGFRTEDREDHDGIDIPAPAWTPIYAIADGVIGKVATESTNPLEGNTVRVNHVFGNNAPHKYVRSYYLHMIQTASVKEGDSVKKGDVIGYVGSTGDSTGNHLHLGTRYSNAQFTVGGDFYEGVDFFNPTELIGT